MNRFRALAAASLLVALAATSGAAQVPLTPRGLGMGGALLGVARGQDALFVNPGNLGLPGTPHWSVAIPQLTFAATLAGADLSDIRGLVGYNDLSDARRDEIFGGIPEAGISARFDARAPIVAFQRGRFAFGAAYGTLGEQTIGRDIVELAFYGYEDGRTDYVAGNSAGWRMSFWDYAVAFSEQKGAINYGFTAHYLRGGTLQRSWIAEPAVDLAARDVNVDYVSVSSRGGKGYALDIGAAYQPRPDITVSGAITNVYASFNWSDELHVRSLSLDAKDFESGEPMDLYDRFKASQRRVSEADSGLTRGLTAADLQDGARLPRTARLGVGWQATGGTDVGASYQSTLRDGRLGGSWERMLGVGVQQRVPLATLRAGYAINLEDGAMLSGGLTFGPLELGVARFSDGEHVDAPRRGWIGAVGLSTRSRSLMR